MSMPPRLTHRQLDVFRAVMGTGHVTRAAESLHSSQPTVSRELARLEQVLGMALFDRVKGRLRPTVRARLLLEEVERSYVGLDRIAATAASLREFAQGRLAVACLPALSATLLPDATRRFLARRPQAGVSITPQEPPLLDAWLTEQRFDLGLTEGREAPPATTLQPLLQADEVAVLPAGHPLLRKRVLAPSDFAGQTFVSLAPADPYRQLIDAVFVHHGIARVLSLDTGSAASVCALVRQGLGVGIVNPLTAFELASEHLHVRPLGFHVPFQVSLVLPALRAPNPLREAYVAALEASAAAVCRRTRP